MQTRIFHICLPANWQAQAGSPTYTDSSLAAEGFIHCSTKEQLQNTLDRYFRNVPEVLIVELQPAVVASTLRFEPGPRTQEIFPHIYGAIPKNAVIALHKFSWFNAARMPLQDAIAGYRQLWIGEVPGIISPTLKHRTYEVAEEQGIITRFEQFIGSTPGCFERSNLAGHITGSAMVVSEDFNEVLLTLHAKLGMWLQLGGHADGNNFVHEVAATEVREESGLTEFQFFDWAQENKKNGANGVAPQTPSLHDQQPLPFDLDAHWIPQNQKDAGHWHYDVRYVVAARRSQPLAITDESHDLRWFSLDEARTVTNERSMHRQFDKVERFKRVVTAQ